MTLACYQSPAPEKQRLIPGVYQDVAAGVIPCDAKNGAGATSHRKLPTPQGLRGCLKRAFIKLHGGKHKNIRSCSTIAYVSSPVFQEAGVNSLLCFSGCVWYPLLLLT